MWFQLALFWSTNSNRYTLKDFPFDPNLHIEPTADLKPDGY